MKEDKKYNFEITRESLLKIREISDKMEHKTFHFHTHILYDIRTSLGENEITYMEIGSYAGGSVSLMSSHPYKTNCYSLDLGNPISPEVVELNVNKFKNKNNNFKYFKGNSQDLDMVNQIKNEVKGVDILFIDGDHTRNGVFLDFNNYQDLVKSGGYICFDDYLDKEFSPEVMGAVDEIVANMDKNKFNDIGTLYYPLLNEFTSFEFNSVYIIQKK